jgi:5-(carboxyamino)imidazole ribonucleotide synthase
MAEPACTAALAPGATIGILGGGQLGRMLAMAAARLGLKTHVYSDESGPAFDVATEVRRGAYDDWDALADFGRSVQVVTYEFENVPLATANHLAEIRPVRPAPQALAVSQDRLTEKEFLSGLGVPVAPFASTSCPADIAKALQSFGAPSILKSRRFGYDGKGQVTLEPGADVAAAFDAIGKAPAILEKRLSFARELSVIAVRSIKGSLAFYDIPCNTHENGILRRSVVPSGLPPAVQTEAHKFAACIANALDYVGVLAVELFDLGPTSRQNERLVVNEIAPRVHNSGHWTIDACAISQFESHVRAIAGWPLGCTARHSDAEMQNLIGPEALDWQNLASVPRHCLHLYGKREARVGRKMGHVTRLDSLSEQPV